jgi:diguanylate cyclase (GGDEF)-like protein
MSEQPLKVLLVEDDPDDAMLAREALSEQWDRSRIRVEHLTCLEDAIEAVLTEDSAFDAVLLDLGLPDSQGMETVERMVAAAPEIPVVVLTGINDPQLGVEAVQRGAQDYLPKGHFDSHLVIRAIRYAIERHRIREELQQSNEELSLLYSVVEATSRSLDRDELFHRLEQAIGDFNFLTPDSGIRLLFCGQDRLDMVLAIGEGCEYYDTEGAVALDECLCGEVARTGKMIVSGIADGDLHHFDCNRSPLHSRGNVVMPILSRLDKRVSGVLCIATRHSDIPSDEQLCLLRTVATQIGIALDNTRLYEKAHQLSLTDVLSGVGNRRLMELMIEKSLALAARGNLGLAVIMLDIDDFKRYNDTHGHSAGDAVIRQLGKIINSSIRAGDIAARYGGEEFLLLLPDSNLKRTQVLAERLRSGIEQQTPVTASFGLAIYQPGMDYKTLLQQADKALYRAKRTGKNRVE